MTTTRYSLIEIGNGVPIKAWMKGVELEGEAKALKAGNVGIKR